MNISLENELSKEFLFLSWMSTAKSVYCYLRCDLIWNLSDLYFVFSPFLKFYTFSLLKFTPMLETKSRIYSNILFHVGLITTKPLARIQISENWQECCRNVSSTLSRDFFLMLKVDSKSTALIKRLKLSIASSFRRFWSK